MGHKEAEVPMETHDAQGSWGSHGDAWGTRKLRFPWRRMGHKEAEIPREWPRKVVWFGDCLEL